MKLVLYNLTYHDCPVEVREKATFTPEQRHTLLKAAYTESLAARTSRLIFHRLFHHAFRVGKAVRTQTDINCGAVPIGLAAVEPVREKVNLHGPISFMKNGGGEPSAEQLQAVDLVNKMFLTENRGDA